MLVEKMPVAYLDLQFTFLRTGLGNRFAVSGHRKQQ